MTQEEAWMKKYQEVMTFIETNFRCKNGFRKDVRFFHLQERYEFHKLEAIRIKKLRQQYPLSARRKIARLLGVSESVVKEDLFHEQYMKDSNRCFRN